MRNAYTHQFRDVSMEIQAINSYMCVFHHHILELYNGATPWNNIYHLFLIFLEPNLVPFFSWNLLNIFQYPYIRRGHNMLRFSNNVALQLSAWVAVHNRVVRRIGVIVKTKRVNYVSGRQRPFGITNAVLRSKSTDNRIIISRTKVVCSGFFIVIFSATLIYTIRICFSAKNSPVLKNEGAFHFYFFPPAIFAFLNAPIAMMTEPPMVIPAATTPQNSSSKLLNWSINATAITKAQTAFKIMLLALLGWLRWLIPSTATRNATATIRQVAIAEPKTSPSSAAPR